jgi:hypothetical protein
MTTELAFVTLRDLKPLLGRSAQALRLACLYSEIPVYRVRLLDCIRAEDLPRLRAAADDLGAREARLLRSASGPRPPRLDLTAGAA